MQTCDSTPKEIASDDPITTALNPKKSDKPALYILRLFGLLQVLFVPVICLMGLLMTLRGFMDFAGVHFTTHDRNSWRWAFELCEPDAGRAISTLMSSLEFYLLSPLCYLFLRTLGNHMYSIYRAEWGYPSEESSAALLSVKAFSMGLLMAVLATHLVSVFLFQRDAGEFPTTEILSGILLLIVLLCCFWVMERLARLATGRESKDDSASDPEAKHRMLRSFSRESGDVPPKAGGAVSDEKR